MRPAALHQLVRQAISAARQEGIDTTARSAVIHMGRMVCESFDRGVPFESILTSVTTDTGLHNVGS
jgi:Protein of unknown function (DUF732)